MNLRLKIAMVLCLIVVLGYAQDIKHYLGFWGGGAYSSVLHSIENTKKTGGVGFLLGGGYEMQLNKLLFDAGIEFSLQTATTKLTSFEDQMLWRYPALENHFLQYNYRITDYRDKVTFGYVSLPLQVGYRFTDRYFAMLGAKFGLNVMGSYKADGLLKTTILEGMAIEELEDMPNHYAVSNYPVSSSGNVKFNTSLNLSAEFGVYLDEWIYGNRNTRNQSNARAQNNSPSYRASLFVNYGLMDIQGNNTQNGLIEYTSADPETPLDIRTKALYASNLSAGEALNPLLVGAKFAVLFQVGHQRQPRRPQRKAPTPRFYVKVVDAETNKNLEAQVVMVNERNVQVMKSNTSRTTGMIARRLSEGTYKVTVTKADYITYTETITPVLGDTLIIALEKKPVFSIYVYDAETNSALDAEITITNTATDKQELKGVSDKTSGLISKIIEPGTYEVTVNKQGYFHRAENADFVSTQTFEFGLTPIKKDSTVVLNNIEFEFAKASLTPDSKAGLDDLSRFLSENPDVQINIVGHTDNVGSETINERLSNERAKAVYDEMVKRGIEPSRMKSEGKGSKEPVATNDTEEGRAKNRRVEFTIQ